MRPSRRAVFAAAVIGVLLGLLLSAWLGREPDVARAQVRPSRARSEPRFLPAALPLPSAGTDASPPLPLDEPPSDEPIEDLGYEPGVAADAPLCGSRMQERPARGIPDLALCDTVDLITVCTAGEEPAPLAPDDLASVLDQAEQVVGGLRRTPLTIVFHDRQSWADFALRRRLPIEVDGLYNGAVHLAPQSGRRLTQTVRHEVFHAALDGAVGCVPRSVHEGMASWFGAEPRIVGWIDALKNGFWEPVDLDTAIRRKNAPTTRIHAYAQAELRVLHATSVGGEREVSEWVNWLRRRDNATATEAWNALRRASDDELTTFASELLFEQGAVDAEALAKDRFSCIYGNEPPLLALGIEGMHAACVMWADDPP